MHTLRERSRKVEQKEGQRSSNEFRRQAVERMNACENVVGLAKELAVCRRVLYNWRDRMDETDPPPIRTRELILRKQINKPCRLTARAGKMQTQVEASEEMPMMPPCVLGWNQFPSRLATL